jgi:hypothetical protein
MTTHHLKLSVEYSDEVFNGSKTFELRKNDRHFMKGDEIIFHEYDKDGAGYTGRAMSYIITYILENHESLSKGYVAMSIRYQRSLTWHLRYQTLLRGLRL